jgi:endoglucanase
MIRRRSFAPLFLALALFPARLAAQATLRLDPDDPAIARQAGSSLIDDPIAGKVFRFRGPGSFAGDARSFALPIELLRGMRIRLRASIEAKDVSAPPESWNGIKVMLKVEGPGGTSWPQLSVPHGSFDWRAFTGLFYIPDEASKASLIIGLERVSGEASMKDISLSAEVRPPRPGPAPADAPIYSGHGPGSLRGAMIDPRTITRSDFDLLTKDWGANVVRWQMTRPNKSGQKPEDYDAWIDDVLAKLDEGLAWAAENGARAVVDLHSPPGGADSVGGYQDASAGLFGSRAAEDHFIAVWRKIAARYKGNRTIWGFDLVNEPIDVGTGEGCLDWNGLALLAARAVREVDPERTIIVEPAGGGSASGFNFLLPLPMDRVVYSFHMYTPGEFTHQGVYFPKGPSYPGFIAGKEWDREALRASMRPAIDFAARYRVRLYVGEFSAARWAPGADRYLADLLSIFEEQGWDWSYHAFREWDGWSLEHGSDPADHKPSAAETPRLAVLRRGFALNLRPDPAN